MGRAHDHNIPRGVTHAHKLLHHGANCSLATNNVLNPFTPFGDCSLLRMANFYANVAQVGTAHDIAESFHMVTSRAAQLMNLTGYGLKTGNDADIVVLDCQTVLEAVRELPPVLSVFKRGRLTVTREAALLHRP
jgi:cytosine deaminase